MSNSDSATPQVWYTKPMRKDVMLTPRMSKEDHAKLVKWAAGRPLGPLVVKTALDAAAAAEQARQAAE